MLRIILIGLVVISECIVCFAQADKNSNTHYKSNNVNKNTINKNNNNIKHHNDKVNNNSNKLQGSHNKRVIRILSLDGGGTRGYIQAKFLELLCNEFGITNLGEYFDLIVGTSIGGINAVALANGMGPNDLIKFFRKTSPWIFTIRSKKDIFSNHASIPSNKPNKLQMLYMIITGNSFYKSVSEESNYGDARLRRELKHVFGNQLLNQLKTKVLLTAYDFSTSNPILFSSTNINNVPHVLTGVKVVDAVMATTSFPIYFPSITLKKAKEVQYNNKNTSDTTTLDAINNTSSNTDNLETVDGGLFQCNPSLLAFIVAKNIYPSANKYCILSIGTGIRQNKINFNKNKSIINNLLPVRYTKIWDVFIQSSKYTSDLLLKTFSNDPNAKLNYYRFDVTLDNNKECSLDTSTGDFFDYLDKKVEAQYNKDKEKIKEFVTNLKDIKKNI